MTDHVKVSRDSRVLEIELARPDKKNALTSAMYRVMTSALTDTSSERDIGAVLIHGAGDAFCAGNDLADFVSGPEEATAAFDFVRAIATFPKPIVAAVQGLAVGVGTTLLFHCDLVYATPDARFIMPFVNLGLVPEAGASLLAPATLGHAKAASMLLLGEPLDALEANKTGLINGIVSNDSLLDHARTKAKLLTAKPAAALLATRRLMKGDPAAITARIEEEARLFQDAMQSPEAREAFASFLEKR